MKKTCLLLIVVPLAIGSLLPISVFSQAYEASIQYNKKKQAAIAIDYSYPPEAVENAFVLRLEKMGFKAKEEKGEGKGSILLTCTAVCSTSMTVSAIASEGVGGRGLSQAGHIVDRRFKEP